MAQDKVTLFNLALSEAGITETVDSPSENSPQAETCRLFFEPVRDHILAAAHWPSAKAAKRLGLLVTRDETADWVSSDPLPGWKHAYAMPADAITPRFMSTYARFESGILSSKRAIFTDFENAILVYTKKQEDISLWESTLFLAVAYGLGAFISMPLNGKAGRAEVNRKQANGLIIEARETAANEADMATDYLPEWIQARGYSGAPSNTRYIHPYGALLNASGAPLV